MDFKLVAKSAVQGTPREGTYDEETKNAVSEIWAIMQEHGSTHHVETAAFADQEAADKWLAKAQAYGKTQGVMVRKARGAQPSVEFALVLTAESLEQREQRIAARKEREAELAKAKEAGEVVKPGRKAAKKKAA